MLRFTQRDVYDSYNDKYKIGRNIFMKILLKFNRLLVASAVDTGLFYKFPYGLGQWGVVKTLSSKGRAQDFPLSKQEGQVYYKSKKATEGYTLVYKWLKRKKYGGNLDLAVIWGLKPGILKYKELHIAGVIKNRTPRYFEYYA